MSHLPALSVEETSFGYGDRNWPLARGPGRQNRDGRRSRKRARERRGGLPRTSAAVAEDHCNDPPGGHLPR